MQISSIKVSLPADVLWGSFVTRTPKDVCREAILRSPYKRSSYSQKNKTSKEEKFNAKMSIRIDEHIFGLDEEVTIPCK